ncbi:MAG: HEAT repeat domain-containing protein [bacterium]
MKKNEHLEAYIPLYLYDELDEAGKKEFEVHLKYCEHCRRRLEEMRLFHKRLDNRITAEPSESLLRRSRNSLRERLQKEQPATRRRGLLAKLTEPGFRANPLLQFAGGLALLIVGMGIGRFVLAPVDFAELSGGGELAAGFEEESVPFTASVDLIQYDPQSGNITVQYKTVRDVSLQGNIKNPSIRHLLVQAIRSDEHPGRRLAAVKAASATPFSDDDLEDALIFAMQNDEVDGVRLRAAKVLSNLPINQKIKLAFIRVLLKDSNPAIRIQALNALSDVEEDDVLPVFQDASSDDANEFVRLNASRALERLQNPEKPNDRHGKSNREEKKQ